MKKIFFILLFFTCFLLSAEDSIRFGVFAYKGVEKTTKQYAPLVEALNEKLGGRVILEVLTQEQIYARIAEGTLDVVTTNATHYLYIRHHYKINGAIATLETHNNGASTNFLAGTVAVASQSKMQKLQDLKGKRIAISSPIHFGAYRTQAYELHLKGIDIAKESTLITTDGSQYKAIKMVLSGEADAAFVRDGIYEEMLESGDIPKGAIRILEQKKSDHPFAISTGLYPEWPVLIMPHVSQKSAKEFTAALLSLKPTQKLRKSGIEGYSLPVDYLVVEELSRTMRLPPFDKAPQVTLLEILNQYKTDLIVISLSLLAGLLYHLRERRRKNFINSLLSNIGDGVYGTNKDGSCIWINQKALALLGYKEEEVLGKDQHLLFHHHKHNDDKYQLEECPIYKTQKDGKTREEKEWFIRKDGSFFPVDLTVASTKNGGAIVVFHDVSEFVHQTEEIAHQKERLHAIIEGTNVGTWEWNIETDEVFLNEKWANMIGYTLEEISPLSLQSWIQHTHPDDLQRAQEALNKHLEGKSDFYECEFRMRHKDGRWIWMLEKGAISRWSEDKKPLYMSGTHQDISERKNAQEELELQRELLELFFRQSIHGFFFMMSSEPIEWNDTIDKEKALDYAFEHQRITKVNQAMLEQYGAKEEEFLGFTPADFFAHDLQEGRKIWRKFFDRGALHVNTHERKLDGTPMVINGDYICLYDKEGRITGYFGVQREITEEIKAKSALQAAKEEAERANSSKSAFLANMSHEIRTPMNAVLGFSEILLSTDVDERQKNYLKKIVSSSKLLLDIINDILDFSKIEASKIEIEHKAFELSNSINKLKMMFKQKASEKGVLLSYELCENLPSVIIGDELRLTQILINLVGNAVKFTKEGAITIALDITKKSDKEASLHVSVRDSGIGMSKEQLQKLFQPFSQADSSITRKYGGTGLGLSISAGLVRAMNGTLEAKSSEGVGSEFYFTINVGVASWERVDLVQEERQEALCVYPDLSHVKLLLVEDYEINQEVVTEILKRVHITPEIANNGKEAVEMFLAKPQGYDIILMDIQMPIMSGYEASKIIREHNQEIPIIALTAAAMVEDRTKALEAGMNEHLSKPIESDAMLGCIAKYFNATCEATAPKQTNILQAKQCVLDVEYAMHLVGQNQALYHRVVSRFLDELQSEFAMLPELLKQKESAAKPLVHSLKGVSGNLGANELATLSAEIDAMLKTQKEITQEKIEQLSQTMQKTIDAIIDYLALHVLEEAEVQAKDLEPFFAIMLKNIQEGTMVELHEQQLLFTMLKPKIGIHELEKWMHAMDNYDYDIAYNIMREWKI